MKFGEVDDCSICPFREGGEYSDLCDHSGNPDHNLPCLDMDKFGDMEIEDVASELYNYELNEEEYREKQYEIKQKQKLKNEEKVRKAKESKMYVQKETSEINRLKKRINNNNNYLNFNQNISLAINTANEMFGDEKRTNVSKLQEKIRVDNEKCQKRIDELKQIKKDKLKELREKRKK